MRRDHLCHEITFVSRSLLPRELFCGRTSPQFQFETQMTSYNDVIDVLNALARKESL